MYVHQGIGHVRVAILSQFYPITVVGIGEGLVVEAEKVLTKASGISSDLMRPWRSIVLLVLDCFLAATTVASQNLTNAQRSVRPGGAQKLWLSWSQTDHQALILWREPSKSRE